VLTALYLHPPPLQGKQLAARNERKQNRCTLTKTEIEPKRRADKSKSTTWEISVPHKIKSARNFQKSTIPPVTDRENHQRNSLKPRQVRPDLQKQKGKKTKSSNREQQQHLHRNPKQFTALSHIGHQPSSLI
jgi:hypothetical protein